MELSQIRPNTYFAKFATQYDMCMTLIRIQEFYESPYKNIQARYFTLEEYMDTWVAEHGTFSYPETWSGFNFSSYIVARFLEHFIGDIRDKEAAFFKQLYKILKGNKRYYVIGGASNQVITHELAHAYFYLDSNYKTEMLELLKTIPADYRKKAGRTLLKKGYDKSVLEDELQAYFIDSVKYKEDVIQDRNTINKQDSAMLKPFYEVFKKYDKAYKTASETNKTSTIAIHV